MKKFIVLLLAQAVSSLAFSQDTATLSKPIIVLDDACLGQKIKECAASYTNFMPILAFSNICPAGWYKAKNVYLWDGTNNPWVPIPAQIKSLVSPESCVIPDNASGILMKYQLCQVLVRNEAPLECRRSADHSAIVSTLKSDLRILLNQMCKANSTDAARCDNELPTSAK